MTPPDEPPGDAWEDEDYEPTDDDIERWSRLHDEIDGRVARPALDDPTDRTLEERAGDLFHRWTIKDLLAADRTFRWTLRGMLVRPTYGMVGGEQKTLKSYVSTFVDLAVATGTPLFDHFTVDDPGPVVAYIGEGGRIPFTRRLERIADAMGITLADADFHPTFDVAPASSLIFEESLHRDLDELHPALVHIDPWYAYHGAQSEGKNLYAEGSLLSGLSQPCIDAGASLLVNHHFNQTGGSRGISRLTMAGAQEWVDSWVLLAHRQDPDVPNGRFYLDLSIGSRQWGGSNWELDLDVGRFDVDTAEYDGAITWDLRRAGGGGASAAHEGKVRILAAVLEHPGELGKEEAAKAAQMNLQTARQLVQKLTDDGLIVPRLADVETSDGRTRKVWRFWPSSGPSDEADDGAF